MMLKIRKHIYDEMKISTSRDEHNQARGELIWRDSKGSHHILKEMNQNYIVNALKKLTSGFYGKPKTIKDGITLEKWEKFLQDELIFTNNAKLLTNVQ